MNADKGDLIFEHTVHMNVDITGNGARASWANHLERTEPLPTGKRQCNMIPFWKLEKFPLIKTQVDLFQHDLRQPVGRHQVSRKGAFWVKGLGTAEEHKQG